jgi:hypothetical protein
VNRTIHYITVLYDKCQKQTNIPKGASQTPLLVSSPPFIKSIHPIHSLVTSSEFWDKKSVTVVLLMFYVFWFFQVDRLQKCTFVWYSFKHGSMHNPTLHFSHLNLICISSFLSEHTQHCTCFPSLGQCWLCQFLRRVVWSVEGVCLPLGAV